MMKRWTTALLIALCAAVTQAQDTIPVATGPVTVCLSQAPPAAASYEMVFDGGPAETVTVAAPAAAGCAAGSTHSFTLPAARFTAGAHTLRLTTIGPGGRTDGPVYTLTVQPPAPGAATVTGLVVDTPPPEPGPQASALLMSPERLAALRRIRASAEDGATDLGSQWYRALVQQAVSGQQYADNGLRAALLYRITESPAYVDLAWAKISGFLMRKNDNNFAREYLLEHAILYDWLRPGLDEARRAAYLARINDLATFSVSNPSSPAMPVNPADSDQTVGVYFGLAALYLATGDHNPTAVELWSRPFVGGFDASSDGTRAMRTAIRGYISQASGGEWIESAEYNLGTVRLLLMGVEAVRTRTGVDHFPEVTAWLPDAAMAMLQAPLPGLRTAWQWGDVESPRSSEADARAATAGMLAGLLEDTRIGSQLQDLVLDLVTEHGAEVHDSHLWPRLWYLFDPSAPRGDRTAIPDQWHASGQGISISRTGWTADDSAFFASMRPGQDYVHHQIGYMGDVQLWRRGAFVITRPIGYDDRVIAGEGGNTLMFGGAFSAGREGRYVVAQESAPDLTYIAGTTGGQVYGWGTYQAPPTFLHEWTRSLVYLPSTDRSLDTIVVFDRLHVQDPRLLPGFAGYRDKSPPDEALLRDAPAIPIWHQHAATAPVVEGDVARWTVGAQHVRLQQVIGQPSTVEAQNLAELWAAGVNVKPSERAYRLRIYPASHHDWQTRLQVIQVSDAPPAGAVTALGSLDGAVEGVHFRQSPAGADVVLLFGARQGPILPEPVKKGAEYTGSAPGFEDALRSGRFIQDGFTVVFESTADETDVRVFDLPPASWQVAIDGAGAVPLAVSAAGVARVRVTGAGPHTVRVSQE